jgi:DNA-binding transcriptional regulator YiaG
MTQITERYRYTGCGVDNVFLVGLPLITDDAGDENIKIPHINKLHRLIAEMLAEKPSGLTPKELRFLRTELCLTQGQLASLLHKDHQTVGRWERGETPLDPTAETIIRMLVLEQVGQQQPVQEVSKRAVPNAGPFQIAIDAHDPSDYRKLAA